MPHLTPAERHIYQQQVLIPSFMPLLKQPIMSVLYDTDGTSLIATNASARSIGLSGWEESAGLSYRLTATSEKSLNVFKTVFHVPTNRIIKHYCNKIFQIQQQVFSKQKVINYVDLLPYNTGFKYYYISCLPVFHPNGEVIALQSFANEGKFWGVQDQVVRLLGKKSVELITSNDFTQREQEILFLLCYGATQEQIAQVLDINRSTVANIILKKLCAKFKIPGSNTKALTESALNFGLYKNMPPSLCRPCVIILNRD